MSGTSTDGVGAVLARLRATPTGYRPEILAHCTLPFRRKLRQRLLEIAEGKPVSAAHLSALNAEIGERLAAAAKAVAKRGGIGLDSVDVIGSHGHTIFHGPPGSGRSYPPSTLQIGEAAVIAARTGVTTVADFRPADVALGGQGAPLVPYVHWLLFTHARLGRAIHNIGGIANLTYLPPRGSLDDVIAFDTGPGNMVIDAVVAQQSKGKNRFDRGGAIAARGEAHEPTVERLLALPFFRQPPPKSTGREQFGAAFAEHLLRMARRARLRPADVVATATALTARSIAEAYQRFVLPRGPLAEIYFAGGGARNATLLREVQQRLPLIRMASLDELGTPATAIEPLSFAVLACETLRGKPANVVSATGALRGAILGKIVPGEPRQWRRLMARSSSR